jgi:membrane associated rhomboid family serine protease
MTLNFAVFVRQLMLPDGAREAFVLGLALVPFDLTNRSLLNPEILVHTALTLLTCMFVHGGLLHLGGNMLYLWVFGSNIEDVMGHGRFLMFYVLCGLAGSCAQVVAAPGSQVPLVGASGAIAGVLGAYLVTFPTARVLTLFVLVVFVRVVPVPALIILGLWLLIQLLNAGQLGPGGVAWFAHLGGFAAGLLLVAGFRRRRVRDSLY